MLCLLKHTELLTSVWKRLDYALILDFVVVVVVIVVIVIVVLLLLLPLLLLSLGSWSALVTRTGSD